MYQLRILGGFSLRQRSGSAMSVLPLTRAEAVLAVLAVCGDLGCTRERLMALLWPESDEAHSRHSLRDALNALRHALGADAVFAQGEHLRLNHSVVISDVLEFSQALSAGRHGEAVAVYGGPLLEGFHVDDAPEFERWLDSERSRLAREHGEALEHLATTAEQSGLWNEAAKWWARAVEHDPVNSRVVLRYLNALAAAGDRANALKAADVHLRRLREELDIEPDREVLAGIERLRRGKTLAPPERRESPTAEDLITPMTKATAAEGIAAEPRRGQARRRWRAGLAVAGTVVLAAFGWWAVKAIEAATGRAPIKRLAVLPLASFTNDTSQDYFVQGVHEALISNLQEAGLTVLGRTSVLRYRRTEEPPRQIARELGVDALIEGWVMRSGDSVEVSVRLIDGRTELARWEHTYSGEVRSVFALYHGVTRAIAEQIHGALGPAAAARLASAQTVDPQAYDDYLQGMFHAQRLTAPELDAALGYFERALRRDSSYALAHAGIAWVWACRSQIGVAPHLEAIPKAIAAANEAAALDSTLAEVQRVLAEVKTWSDWDWAGGEAAFKKAIEINRNDAQAHAEYSHLLYLTGRPQEGRAEMDRAVALDPLSSFVQGFRGVVLEFYERRFDSAIVEFRQALVGGNQLGGDIVDALHLAGRDSEAVTQLRKMVADDKDLLAAANRGWAEGGWRGVNRRFADLLAARPSSATQGPAGIAFMYADAGDKARELEWLERAYRAHDPNLPYVCHARILSLPEEPRFRDLCRRMGLPI